MKQPADLNRFLDQKVALYNQPSFISRDPVSIPHRFTKKEDIEISGFFAAIFSWGNRTTIINKSLELMARMDHAPHQFVCHHKPADLIPLQGFSHRTFNGTDLLYCLSFLQQHYTGKISPGKSPEKNPSLETAFSHWMNRKDTTTEKALMGFHSYFFSLADAPERTRKHVATPARGSSCKRLNMYLRWMVRHDRQGVDFGIWKKIRPAQLVCPLDVHVVRVARRFGLLKRPTADWKAAVELTENLKRMNARDPVRYDFALFGLGIEEKY